VDVFAIVVAVVAVSTAVSGIALLLTRRAMVSAALLVCAGAAGILAAVLLAADHDRSTAVALVAGASLFAPAALVTFPQLRWRHPVDFISLVVIVGCGAIGTSYADANTGVVGVMGLLQGCALLVHTWWRIEVSADRERRALVWMALALIVATIVYFFLAFSAEGFDSGALPSIGTGVFALIAPAMYVGATLPELVDVRALVVRTVVHSVALVTVMAVFVLALGLLDSLGAHELNVGAQALLAALSASIYQPTCVILRGVVDQLLFGERPDPLGAASAVADRIGADPVVALRAIREALVIPYAAVVVDGVPLASSGSETTHTRSLDLDGAGELVVGLRPGDLAFSPGDEHVLRLTVPLLAQTLRARALAEQLIESRGQTIAAVEEERRRLRRELHDGLGPRLSGVAFTSDAARNLIRTDPAAAEEMVAQLRADTVTAIEEIRRMVYAMRPPALDELGLVPALRQQAVGLRNRDGNPVAVDVSAPSEFPDLPAAVEVAAYRIVTEALTNVARHSTSPSASVRLQPAADGLHLEVTDHGSRNGAWRPGVGMASMRERATELGGSLEAGPGPSGGRVSALLPL
jgi:two-component system NarL family sensor kinase